MCPASTERHIVAMGGGGFSDDDPILDRYVLELVSRTRPRVCFLPTATGNVATYVTRFLEAFPASRFEPSFLDLYVRDDADVRAFLLEQDVIYVGGGNTANLLAIWRVHGADAILREAWEAGVVLAGVSAGESCWFEGCTTDSFGPEIAALSDGLGLLAGSFCPHYDGEPARRPTFHRLVGAGELTGGIACDDFAGVHFVGTELHEVVASREGAGAYEVALDRDARVTEDPLSVRYL
jgi:dipeptidase E